MKRDVVAGRNRRSVFFGIILFKAVKFVYFYRSADGEHHQGEMEAPDREEVFIALRKQKIRPIKVIRKDDLDPKARGIRKRWVAVIVAVAVLIASVIVGAVVWNAAQTPDPAALSGDYAEATKGKMEKLVTKARARKDKHDAELKLLNLDMMRDYEKIAKASSPADFSNEVAKARAVIEATRADIKDLFRDLYTIFPPEAENERRDAQKLYGEIMSDIDVSEERINADELVVSILLSSKESWTVEKGKIRFSDPKLEREFQFFRKDADVTVTRWNKDFGPKSQGVIESEIIEVRRLKK